MSDGGRGPERIWVTRARPGAEATARKLQALGFDPLVSPLLEARPVPAAIDLEGAAAIAFTSANAVRAFAAVEPGGRGLPVFTVGEATAEVAREAGFTRVEASRGAVRELARLLAARTPGPVLNPTAVQPAADLAALLEGSGVEVRSVAVYETAAVRPAEALAALDEVATVLVHSPKTARGLVELLDEAALARLEFVCISETAAQPLIEAGAARVAFARRPEEPALLGLLGAGPAAPIRLLDARFWTAIAFLVLCLVAAVVVAVWGPKLWPKRPAHPAPPTAGVHAKAAPPLRETLPLRAEPR